MPKRVNWSEKKETLHQMYNEYCTLSAVGKKLGLTRERMRQIFNELNIPYKRRPKPTRAQKDRVVELYRQGKSPEEIGGIIGFSTPTIYRMLKEAGVFVYKKRRSQFQEVRTS